jgi:HEAT repeat protein
MRHPRPRWWWTVVWAGAMVLLVGLVGLSAWWFSPRERVRRLIQEIADQPGFDDYTLRWVRSPEAIDRDFLAMGKQAVPPLIEFLHHPLEGTRQIAAWQLGLIRDREGVLPLIGTLGDPDPLVRHAAAKALGQIGDIRAGDALITSLEDTDGGVRSEAAAALVEIGEKRAVGPLIAAVKTGTARAAGARSLAKLGAKEGIPAMVAALKDKEDFIRKDVAIALGQLGSLEAVPELITGLLHTAHYPGDRLEIIDLLVKLRDPRAREALAQAAATDITSEVREAARKALLAFPDARPSSGTSPGSAPVK